MKNLVTVAQPGNPRMLKVDVSHEAAVRAKAYGSARRVYVRQLVETMGYDVRDLDIIAKRALSNQGFRALVYLNED